MSAKTMINECVSVAFSTDGTKLVAATQHYEDGNGSVYISDDSGDNWTQTGAPTNEWNAVTCSADGTTLIAECEDDFSGNDLIYISRDSGATWTYANAPAGIGRAIACSANASNIVAAGSSIYSLQSPDLAPPLPPRVCLNIIQSDKNMYISWLVPSTKFKLQGNPDVSSSEWTDVLTTPTLNFTNLNYEIKVSPTLSRSFYRLKEQ